MMVWFRCLCFSWMCEASADWSVLGTIASLKSHKKDVAEMRKGTECGIGFDGFTAFEVGDLVQCYEEKSERRTL